MVKNPIKGVSNYFVEVKQELKKSSWPTRAELIESATIIIVSVLLLGLFVFLCDRALGWLIGQLAR